MKPFTAYCTVLACVGIVANVFFLLVTRLQQIERVQEVLVFMRSISVAYSFMALTIMAVAPQSITLGASNIRIPHGILVVGNFGATSNFMVSPSLFALNPHQH